MLQNNSWMGITQYALEDTVVRTEWSASLAFDSQCQVNNKWQMIDFCCEKIGIATLHFRNGLSQHFSVCCLVVGVLGNGMFAILGEYQVNKERGRYLVNTSVKVQSYKERWWGDLQTIVISWPSNSGSALPPVSSIWLWTLIIHCSDSAIVCFQSFETWLWSVRGSRRSSRRKLYSTQFRSLAVDWLISFFFSQFILNSHASIIELYFPV